MFMKSPKKNATPKSSKKGIVLGGLKGKISILDDFNEPLDDLNEYMF